MSDLLLAIDTAGPLCAAAVYDRAAGCLLSRAYPEIGRGHAEQLMQIVADVLAEAGTRYADLAQLAVVVGPGSFTGLRVGVAAAKGLSLALGIPLVGVTALEVLAEPHRGGPAAVLAVMDAKRGEVYAALFAASGEAIRGPRALIPADLPSFVADEAGRRLVLVGTGAAIARAALGLPETSIAPGSPLPDIAAVARIAASRGTAGALEAPVIPLYLRGADAKPSARGIAHAAETRP